MFKLLKWSWPALFLGLTACNDAFIQDPGYGGYGRPPSSSYGMSDWQLERNCRYEVEDRIERRVGHRADIRFDDTRVRYRNRDEARVTGIARVRKDQRRYRVSWRCDIDRYDGDVLHSELDWNQTSAGGDADVGGERNRRALHMCTTRIEEKIRRDLKRYVTLSVEHPRVDWISRKRRHVTGEAVAKVSNGRGRASFSCKVAFEPPVVESAGYRWLKRPPRGEHQPRARDLCKQALKKRLHHQGWKKIEFLKVNARPLSVEVKLVTMKTRLKRPNKKVVRHFECRVNVPRQRVLSLSGGW